MAGQATYRYCLVPLAGKVVALHTIKGEGVSEGLAPLVPNFSIRLRLTARFTPQPSFTPGEILPLPIVYEVGWAAVLSGRFGDEKTHVSLPVNELRFVVCSLRSILSYPGSTSYWRVVSSEKQTAHTLNNTFRRHNSEMSLQATFTEHRPSH